MAEEPSTNFPDLNAVLDEQQATISELTKQLKDQTADSGSETIFNTTPQAAPKPRNFVVIGLIAAVGYLLFFRS